MSEQELNGPSEPGALGGIRPWAVLRDVAIVFGLTFVGGFVVGFAFAMAKMPTSGPSYMAALAGSNLVLGPVGFAIAGSLAPADRWRHLAVVAVGVWLTGLINVAGMGTSIALWAFSAIIVAVMMAIGGAVSYLFKP